MKSIHLSIARGIGVALGLFLPICGLVRGDNQEFVPDLQISPGLPGDQVRLTWPSEAGLRYRVERSTDLTNSGPGGWSLRALVDTSGPTGQWLDTEPTGQTAFYRLSLPSTEVFSAVPTVLAASGGSILVHGQCLPPGSFLTLDFPGLPPVSTELVFESAGVWRATFVATLPPGSVVSARVTDALGATLLTLDQQFVVTATGRAEDGPPGCPPASPVRRSYSLFDTFPTQWGSAAYGSGGGSGKASMQDFHFRLAGTKDEDCDDEDEEDDALGAALGTGKVSVQDLTYTHPIPKPTKPSARAASGLPGEVSFQTCDLSLPCPAGPRLAWVRTYRSKKPVSSGHGPGWDFSYNIWIESTLASDGSTISSVTLHDGGGRADTFKRQPDGSYACDGMFRLGTFSGPTGTVFTLTFSDKGTWVFNPLDGSPAAGKISSITDRFGVALTCAYDASTGLLSSVSDAFGRSLSVIWSPRSNVERIIDHTGRQVDFVYYDGLESGGSEGDLKSVSCPGVSGLPPVAGPTTYSYTTGSSDDNLNHNLLSVTDGAGRLLEAFTYSAATAPTDVEYDVCATYDLQGGGHVTVLKLQDVPPGSSPPGAYAVFENDEVGRVTEVVYDAMHRPVVLRQHTGFATPGVEVTSASLPLSGQLRTIDPTSFECDFAYNADHCLTRATLPDGSQMRFTWQRDSSIPACPVRERGNLRVCTLRSPGGEERTITMDYLPGFGSPELGVCGNPIGGLTIKGGKNPGGLGGVTGDDVDQDCDGRDDDCDDIFARPGKPVPGIGVIVKSLDSATALLKKEEGGRHTPFHNKYRPQYRAVLDSLGVWDGGEDGSGCTEGRTTGWNLKENKKFWDDGGAFARATREPRAHYDIKKNVKARVAGGGDDVDQDCDSTGDCDGDEPAGILIAMLSKKGYDYYQAQSSLSSRRGWDGKVKGSGIQDDSFCTRLVTAHGQVYSWSYDAKGCVTACTTPVAGAGLSATYNTLGQCTSLTVLDGTNEPLVTGFTYDNDSAFLLQETRDPSGLNLSISCARDDLGRVTSVTNPLGGTWSFTYNPMDRLTSSSTPEVRGFSIATTYAYDAAGRLARCDTEHRDGNGLLVAANPAYSTFFVRDSRCRLIQVAREERPVDGSSVLEPGTLGLENFAVCDITYDAAGQVARLSTPASSRGQSSDAVCDFLYDERGLLFQRHEGGIGNPDGVVTEFAYTTRGAIAGIVVGSVISSSFTYDGFHRLASETDPMGNQTTYSYDNQGFVTCLVYGEQNDVPGAAGNTLLAKIRYRTCTCPPGRVAAHASSHGSACLGYYNEESGTWAGMAAGSHFHGVAVEDDTVVVTRFSPGETGEDEVTVCDRSPSGLLRAVTRNGISVLTCGYDSAARLVSLSDGATTLTRTLDDNGGTVLCGQTDHFRSAPGTHKSFSLVIARDGLGLPISVTDGSGNVTECKFDSLGRPVEMRKLDPDDPGGLVIKFVVKKSYDSSTGGGAGTPPADYSVLVEADAGAGGAFVPLRRALVRSGECRSVTDSYGHTTTITSDACRRVTRCDFPDGTYIGASFDAFSNVAAQTYQDGSMRTLTCDLNGRVTGSSLAGAGGTAGSPPVVTTYGYDGLGRRCTCHQGYFISSRVFDSVGNQLSETVTDSSGTAPVVTTVLRSFGANGRTGITYPDGVSFAEERDHLGRLLSVSSLAPDGSGSPIASFDYLGHRVCTCDQANGVRTVHTFRGDGDAALLPGDSSFGACVQVSVSDASSNVLSRTRYARDVNQRVITCDTAFAEGTAPPMREKAFTRDRLGHVTTCVTNKREFAGGSVVLESSVTYTLDLEGRRLSATGGANPGIYSQDDALPPGDQQMGQYTSWPGGPLVWDANGNLTSLGMGATGQFHLSYDVEGRLASSDTTFGDPAVDNEYDGYGRRVKRTVRGASGLSSVTTRFVYDGGVCIQEVAEDGLPDLTFAVAGGLRVCISTRAGTLYYPHGGGASSARGLVVGREQCDDRNIDPDDGCTSMVTGATGGVVERFDCDDACRPIFLDASGLLSSAVSSVSGLRWLRPACAWEPELQMFHSSSGVYSPALGCPVASNKIKALGANGEGKKEYVGHVTLLK